MKQRRIQIEVRPGKVWSWVWRRPESGWHVTIQGALLCARRRKEDAVFEALGAARAAEPSELTIKGKDGRIQDRRTYPRSSDPRRSKG